MINEVTVDITPDTFDAEVLQSSLPVLVDFWADWCSPCKVLGPQVDRIAREHVGTLKVVKFDAGKHTDFAKLKGVSSLPTLLVFIGGQQVAQKIGAVGGYPAIKQLITPHLPTV